MPDPSPTFPPPGLPRRLAALVYDTLLVIPLVGITVALVLLTVAALTGAAEDDNLVLQPVWVQLIGALCVIGFYTAFWSKGGQTLGMQAWRIQVLDGEGNPPHPARCVLRCLAALVSLAPAGLGYWWMLVDRERRSWHDRLSGTHLVLLPKSSRSKS
ncbi:RDD family protein [Haliea atlantica]|nr:transporter [Haliea sp.]|tara:strand:- start:8774 stop:9244 length:471 start_codon:yes stop_codon:yes gene_type:complete